MAERASASSRRAMTSAALEALLVALHPERERAAEKYEEIRERLRIFFVWRGARWPEDMTDETIDRVGRRVLGGEVIRTSDVGRYFLGVARNVLRESWQRHPQRVPEEDVSRLADTLPAPTAPVLAHARLDCLEKCLAELPADTRELVYRYHRERGAAKIEDHRALAAQLGVSTGTLRIRLHRLRARLQVCVRRCTSEDGP